MWKFLGIALFVSTLAVAVESEPLEVETIPAGTYRTSGWSHYQDGKVTITPWADRHVLKAMLNSGNRFHEVKVNLIPLGNNEYRGEGIITVRYGKNKGCQHRFGSRVWLTEGKVFIRENTPKYVPYNPYGPCLPAGPYVWFDHPEAYEKQ